MIDKRALGPQNYWRLHMAALQDGVFSVDGFIALPGQDARRTQFLVNGIPADVEFIEVPKPFVAVADYLSETEKVGFLVRARVEQGIPWAEIQPVLSGRPMEAASPLMPSHIYLGDKSRLDIPDEASIRRVSGTLANANTYINEGYSEYRRLRWILDRHWIGAPEPSVLDWGSGCGRVTRHLIDDPSLGPITGIDIDAENVRWCQEHLAADFRVVPLAPPTSLDNTTIDIVVSSSVLSHLTWELAHQWLDELRRVCRPGALLVLSYHGTASTILHRAHDEKLLVRSLRSGFDADERSADLDGYVPDREYYRNTFMNDDRAHALFTKQFDLVTLYESVLSGSQNAAVLTLK